MKHITIYVQTLEEKMCDLPVILKLSYSLYFHQFIKSCIMCTIIFTLFLKTWVKSAQVTGPVTTLTAMFMTDKWHNLDGMGCVGLWSVIYDTLAEDQPQ